MKKNVLITGGTGFVGKFLVKELLKKGYSVSVLSRSQYENNSDVSYYQWDVTAQQIDEAAVLQADYIVHLSGENIAQKRWTIKRKEEIHHSRVDSGQLIYSVLKKHNKRLEAFVSASAVGYYGAVSGEGICTEATLPGNDFLGKSCQDWEKAADLMAGLGVRTVKIRSGVVLGKNGGIIQALTPIFKKGLGSALGSGKQYMPWIHIRDLCRIYIEAIENTEMSGAFNATISDSTTNLYFTRVLAKSLDRPLWLPNIPSFLLRLLVGEKGAVLLTGRRVSSDKLKKIGFDFQYLDLKKAVRDVVK